MLVKVNVTVMSGPSIPIHILKTCLYWVLLLAPHDQDIVSVIRCDICSVSD